jgi:hypothetical protein
LHQGIIYQFPEPAKFLVFSVAPQSLSQLAHRQYGMTPLGKEPKVPRQKHLTILPIVNKWHLTGKGNRTNVINNDGYE